MTPTTDDLIAALEPLTSRVRTDVTAVKGEFGMAWTREALTRVRLKRHVEGALARGVCPIRAGESTTRVALFDLDSHGGQTPWPEMTATAMRLVDAAAALGVELTAWRSSGGRGVHLFAVWEEPQDAYSVRMRMRQALAAIGLKDGAKGVAAGQVEVFPKQDQVPEHGFGNQFILPLFGKSVPLEPLADLEVMPREYAVQLPWTPSKPVPVVEKPVREPSASATPAELRDLEAALAAIPNDTDPLGYDEWRDVIAGIHHATEGSEEGYELAYVFSSRAPHFDEHELRVKVWDWLSNKGHADNPITVRTVLAKAREHGWSDATPDDFDDVTALAPAEGGQEIALPPVKFARDANGRIEATAMHLRTALERPDFIGVDIRFDEFRHELCFAPYDEPGQWRSFTDHHYFDLRLTLEKRGFKNVAKELLRDAVQHRAKTTPIDTAMVWLDGLKWDGVPRAAAFFSRFFGVADTAYSRAVGRYVWSALAGRVLRPGIKADMVPILAGEQGLQKTTGVEAMAPLETFREMSFNEPEDARARKMRGALVAELAELTGLKSRDREEIKAWISRRREEWTPKYMEFTTRLERRLLFFATSNPTNLLDDPTGERRWLPMLCSKVDAEGIAQARDQLWAEGRELFEAHGVLWQEAERLARAEHADFRDEDAWEDTLWAWANSEKLGGGRVMDEGFTTAEALFEGLGLRQSAAKRGDQVRCAQALRHLGFEQKVQKTAGSSFSRKSVKRWVYGKADVHPSSTDLA